MKVFTEKLEKEAMGAGLGYLAGGIGKGLAKQKSNLAFAGLAGAATTIGPTAGRKNVKDLQQARFGQLPKQPKSPMSGIVSGTMLTGPVGLLAMPFQLGASLFGKKQ